MLVAGVIVPRFAKLRRDQRQAPVHHQHFAVLAEHDVLGLEVAMNDAARVGEADGVGHLQQDFEVLWQRFLLPCTLTQGVPCDALHRIEQRPDSFVPRS